MGKNFHLQEKIFHFTTIPLRDMLEYFIPYEGRRSLDGITIPLNTYIEIPFVQERLFYAVRIVPYFRAHNSQFGIPNIELYGSVDDVTGEFVIDTEYCTLRALYDGIHPGYRIISFDGTYEYVCALLSNIELRVQVLQHMDEDPLSEVGYSYCDKTYGFGIIKDGVIEEKDIVLNKTKFALHLESIHLSSLLSTYNRSIISVAYPVHKSLLVSGFIPVPQGVRSPKISGITYDDGFYSKPGVPLQRSFFATLNFSGRIIR